MMLIVKHISIEGPGFIGDYFKGKGYSFKTVELEKGEKVPDSLQDIEAVVVLGGPMNVYEEEKYSYLKKEDIFIKKTIEAGVPFIGLCLGAQLLAKACGAIVKKSSVEEIGFFRVNLTSEAEKDILFEGLDKNIEVFQWHGDTFGIPEGGILLATGDKCMNQAFRIGNNAYGLQFHLEVDGKAIGKWAREYFDSTDKALNQRAQDMVMRYGEIKDELTKNAEKMCRNFEKAIKSFNNNNNIAKNV